MLYHHHIESVSFGPIQFSCQAAADTGQALGSSVCEGKDDLDSTVASIAARLMDGCSPGGFTDFRSSFCKPGDKVSKLSKHISNSQTQTWGTSKRCMAARLETNSFQSKSRQADPSHWLNRATCCMGIGVIFNSLVYMYVFLMLLDALRCFFKMKQFPQRFPPHDFPRTASASKTRVVPRGLGSQRMNRNPQQKSPWEFRKEGPGISWGIYHGFTAGARGYLLIPLFSPGGLIWVVY